MAGLVSVRAQHLAKLGARQLSTNANIAVVGGGAAGFYTAARLLSKTPDVHVDIFERLPAPYGLVRYGVAPDHPEVKNCTAKFSEVSGNARVRFFGNVDIGGSLSVSRLQEMYDGVVLAYGTSTDRRLNIPGEDGDQRHIGMVSARQFVAWYNGLPEAQNLAPDLSSHDTVVVVGHGNVALDCARILLAPVETLACTDMTVRAVEALKESRIRHVQMVGRRGPLQVSFTTKELREMTKLSNVQVVCDRALVEQECSSSAGQALLQTSRPLRRMMDLLLKHAVSPDQMTGERTFQLRFLRSPLAIELDEKVQRVRLAINRLEGESPVRAVATGDEEEVACAMALRSVGYAGQALEGVPFDGRVVPNIAGRVMSGDKPVHGLYVAGWIKRGPVGVIATTMQDAYRTADAVLMDLNSQAIGGQSTLSNIDSMLELCGINPVSNEDWRRLDAYEVSKGQTAGKPREKVTSVQDMLNVIRDK
ncbi:NADPH-adrenodoxin reductase [Coemansia sp. RSA 2705]|nr:NADPH-adrenodoxin reductase [Coemansia sp. RSA 2705]